MKKLKVDLQNAEQFEELFEGKIVQLLAKHLPENSYIICFK